VIPNVPANSAQESLWQDPGSHNPRTAPATGLVVWREFDDAMWELRHMWLPHPWRPSSNPLVPNRYEDVRSWVYFVQGPDHRMPIKIGLSADPDERLRHLRQRGTQELHFEALLPGELGVERALHRRFAEGRIGGEWFSAATPGLLDFMEDARHFEHFYWPNPDDGWLGDCESPCILDILAFYDEVGS
jgi:hypothetical protein